jgi:DNA-binding NarL/FixJ family response regulator
VVFEGGLNFAVRRTKVKDARVGRSVMGNRILFVSDDVMFWARVQAAARSLAREAVRIGGEEAMEEAYRTGGVTRVIVDLGSRSVDPLAWAARWKAAAPPPELVAFGSHVDEAALTAARAAGFDRVMPNSRFHRSVAELVS